MPQMPPWPCSGLLKSVRASLLVCLVVLPLAADPVAAEVERVEITDRRAVPGGPFGDAGEYELLRGTIHFAFDPAEPANAAIVDLARAPRREDGLVTAHGDLVVLKPVDPARGAGTALLEVSNRGGMASLNYFNGARYSRDPREPADFGDGLLMRQGLTVIWVGWQFDVPEEPGRLRLQVPRVGTEALPVTGLVRADWVVDAPTEVLPVAHREHIAYPVLDPDDARCALTVRTGREAARRLVPRESWRFAVKDGEAFVPDATHIALPGGFEVGSIYELVYPARDPAVVGLGLAALRDTISHAKHDEDSAFPVTRGLAVGISQTGRLLRQFLYQGFNTDAEGRPAFDGMLIHTAGAGRGSFNHRFAQPSRDAHRYSAFFYPTDLYPFTSLPQRDPLTRRQEGLLDRTPSRHVPKIFATNTGYEYWGRAAALIHVSPDGARDVALHPNERLYHLASGQHFVSRSPHGDGNRLAEADGWLGNPLDFLVTERALLVALQAWVDDDVEPPPTRVPRLTDGTLVPVAELEFPAVLGLQPPAVPHVAYRADYGPRFGRGIVDQQPPSLGRAFPALVPQVDSAGNERGGVPTLEILVPLATYTPWSLREGFVGSPEEMRDFMGCYVPLSLTEADRRWLGDGRPSIEFRYPSRDVFMEQADAAADELVSMRVLLPEDRDRVVLRAAERWDGLHRK